MHQVFLVVLLLSVQVWASNLELAYFQVPGQCPDCIGFETRSKSVVIVDQLRGVVQHHLPNLQPTSEHPFPGTLLAFSIGDSTVCIVTQDVIHDRLWFGTLLWQKVVNWSLIRSFFIPTYAKSAFVLADKATDNNCSLYFNNPVTGRVMGYRSDRNGLASVDLSTVPAKPLTSVHWLAPAVPAQSGTVALMLSDSVSHDTVVLSHLRHFNTTILPGSSIASGQAICWVYLVNSTHGRPRCSDPSDRIWEFPTAFKMPVRLHGVRSVLIALANNVIGVEYSLNNQTQLDFYQVSASGVAFVDSSLSVDPATTDLGYHIFAENNNIGSVMYYSREAGQETQWDPDVLENSVHPYTWDSLAVNVIAAAGGDSAIAAVGNSTFGNVSIVQLNNTQGLRMEPTATVALPSSWAIIAQAANSPERISSPELGTVFIVVEDLETRATILVVKSPLGRNYSSTAKPAAAEPVNPLQVAVIVLGSVLLAVVVAAGVFIGWKLLGRSPCQSKEEEENPLLRALPREKEKPIRKKTADKPPKQGSESGDDTGNLE